MPMFYFCFVCVMVSKIYIFAGTVPWVLGVGFPTVMAVCGAVRCSQWLTLRSIEPSDEEVRQRLRQASLLLSVLYPVLVTYDFLLYSYGSPDQQFVVIFQLVLASFVLLSFLVHLKTSVFLLLGISTVPTMILLVMQDTPISHALFLSIAIVSMAVVTIMKTHAREFEQFVLTQIRLEKLGEENMRLASTDAVTTLPNRREFFRRMADELAYAKAGDKAFSIGIVDLDGFKAVNDTYGHKVGDRVLTEVAKRLCGLKHEQVTFYRLGGDEFAFMVIGAMPVEDLGALGARVIEAVSPPIVLGSITTSVGCSIGIASYPEAASETDVLFEYCDFALYEAKRGGRLRTVVFSEAHRRRMVEESAAEHALRQADFDAELYPVFQPIIDTRTGTAVAVECLARWHSPKLGHVSPAVFIASAEQKGMISKITMVMLKKALGAMKSWPEDVKMSFNLSSHDIASEGRVREILALIAESGIAPQRLVFELTETAFILNYAAARSNIEFLRKAGVSLALDDFGAGYSSLSHVHELPLDKLKIDRRFIGDVVTNTTSRSIVRYITLLCNDLGIECVVEGVETEAQLSTLTSFGCHLIQGYYFAKPMIAEDIADYLMREREAGYAAGKAGFERPASDGRLRRAAVA